MCVQARGAYVSRMLSFQGASFELIKTPLPADVHDMYCAACEFWADLLVRLFLRCLEHVGPSVICPCIADERA